MRVDVGTVSARVVEATPEERAWLREYLTFDDPQARFANTNRYIELVNAIDDTFPAGFAGKVRAAGARATPAVEVQLVDVRTRPAAPQEIEAAWLRPYQRAALDAALKRTRGIVQISTGGGKTEVMAALVTTVRVPWLILVPQADLLEQTAARIEARTGERPGLVGDGEWNPQRVTVATFQTLHRRLTKGTGAARAQAAGLVASAQGLVVDECFPAGTLVGNTPIESLRVGDVVPSFDEARCAVVARRVVRTFRKKPTSLVSVCLADGRRIVCTEEHPFFVENGEWLPAKSIGGLRVLHYPQEALNAVPDSDGCLHQMQHADSTQEPQRAKDGLLHDVPTRAAGGSSQARDSTLSRLRRFSHVAGQSWLRAGAKWAQLLWRGAQAAVGVRAAIGVGIQGGDKKCSSLVCAHDCAQSDAYARRARKNARLVEGAQSSAGAAGREWPCATCSASAPMGCVGDGLAGRIPYVDESGAGSAASDQIGPRASRVAFGCRGGRRVAWISQGEGAGRAKNSVPRFVRVDRVEVHEPGSDGEFGPLCPDGHVYNIEVEGTHTYLVDGVVVHNCHTVAAGSLNLVCQRATSAYYRIGFSATPLDRSDRKSIFVVAQLGGIIHQTTSAELRALGMLAEAKITMVRVEQGSKAPTWQGVYGDCVVRSKARNAVVVQMAVAATKPSLVFVSQVGHGQKLMPALTRAGVRAALVWGEHDTDERRAALARLTGGELDVVVCSSVFQQAVDIPSLRSVVNAAGGASIVQTLQRIGRGTRVTADKKEFEVWDVLDAGHRWLSRHGAERQATYEREGYRVTVLDAVPGGETVEADPRRDEHGFVLGSAASDAHRAALRREALSELAGVDGLRNPRRGRILRPHDLVGYACRACGAPADALPPECTGAPEAQTHLFGSAKTS